MAGPSVEMDPSGPYIVTGLITIADADGNELHVEEGRTVKLCRCGHSGKKPYSDDTRCRSTSSRAHRSGRSRSTASTSGRCSS